MAAKIAALTSVEWRSRWAGKDVCCAIVASVEEALADPHFVARGLFARKLAVGGQSIAAVPVPVDPQFRGEAAENTYPLLGEHNEILTPPLKLP